MSPHNFSDLSPRTIPESPDLFFVEESNSIDNSGSTLPYGVVEDSPVEESHERNTISDDSGLEFMMSSGSLSDDSYDLLNVFREYAMRTPHNNTAILPGDIGDNYSCTTASLMSAFSIVVSPNEFSTINSSESSLDTITTFTELQTTSLGIKDDFENTEDTNTSYGSDVFAVEPPQNVIVESDSNFSPTFPRALFSQTEQKDVGIAFVEQPENDVIIVEPPQNVIVEVDSNFSPTFPLALFSQTEQKDVGIAFEICLNRIPDLHLCDTEASTPEEVVVSESNIEDQPELIVPESLPEPTNNDQAEEMILPRRSNRLLEKRLKQMKSFCKFCN